MDDAKSGRPHARLIATGLGIPFVLAVVAHVAGPTPARVAAAPSRGSLVISQYLVDLGAVAPTQDVVAHFDFKNCGSHPLEIQPLEPSCGCLRPHLQKSIYAPGEDGFFSLRVQTANQSPGQKEYTVKVKYNDPEPHETTVVFRVILPDDQVLVRPIALMFYQIGDGSMQTEPRPFDVIDRRRKHLNIVKVECSRKDVEIEESTSGVDEDGAWHGRFLVTVPDKLPPGHTETIVRIYTDDPHNQYRVLRIPLYLEGPTRRHPSAGPIQQTSATMEKASQATPKKDRIKLRK